MIKPTQDVTTNDDRANNDQPSATTTASTNDDSNRKKKRQICDICQRPAPQVCICEALPATKQHLSNVKVIILQHPKEFKHKNRSVPILELCWRSEDLKLAVGRRLGDQLPNDCQALLQPPHLPVLVFPLTREEEATSKQSSDMSSKTSLQESLSLKELHVKIDEWKKNQVSSNTGTDDNTEPKVILLALDATWKYAREMHKANLQGSHYPSHMLRLGITADDLPTTFQASRFEIRTTPTPQPNSNPTNTPKEQPPPSEASWMSTGECVAWLVSELEGDASIYETVLKPLDSMVTKWNSFIAEHKQRNKKQRTT